MNLFSYIPYVLLSVQNVINVVIDNTNMVTTISSVHSNKGANGKVTNVERNDVETRKVSQRMRFTLHFRDVKESHFVSDGMYFALALPCSFLLVASEV